MLYVQFYNRDAYGALQEPCGDRAVVILDARLRNETNFRIAESECKKRGYRAFALFRGEAFTRSKQVSCVRDVEPAPVPVNTHHRALGM